MDLIERLFPDVEVLNLGGGFKVARGDLDKQPADVKPLAKEALQMIADFNTRTGRNLRAEIEPGTFLVANVGVLLAEVIDVMSTKHQSSEGGHNFIKLNTGLNDVTRPSLYGAQHSIKFFTKDEAPSTKPFVIVGHCCESGDLLTCDPNDANELREIAVPSTVQAGDYALIKGTGAYCSAMSLKNYNSFPEIAEVMIMQGSGEVKVIRKRQQFEDIMKNEVDIFK